MGSGQLASRGRQKGEEWRGMCTEGCSQELEDGVLTSKAYITWGNKSGSGCKDFDMGSA